VSLKERLEEDIKAAMKAREAGKARLSVLRLLKAAVRNREIERGRELTDEEVAEVAAREVKARREVLPDYARSGREELVRRLEAEILVLKEYLPAELSPAELTQIARRVIAETGAKTPKDIGRVMGPLLKVVRGRAEGSEARRVVERLLEEQDSRA
jgi:uncharacterized protein YqeY